jgi:hypothetical protein
MWPFAVELLLDGTAVSAMWDVPTVQGQGCGMPVECRSRGMVALSLDDCCGMSLRSPRVECPWCSDLLLVGWPSVSAMWDV